jgi:hypothetical protein
MRLSNTHVGRISVTHYFFALLTWMGAAPFAFTTEARERFLNVNICGRNENPSITRA